MRTVAFTMKLKPGFEAEYKKRHDEIWPELVKELEDAGVSPQFISSEQIETGALKTSSNAVLVLPTSWAI